MEDLQTCQGARTFVSVELSPHRHTFTVSAPYHAQQPDCFSLFKPDPLFCSRMSTRVYQSSDVSCRKDHHIDIENLEKEE